MTKSSEVCSSFELIFFRMDPHLRSNSFYVDFLILGCFILLTLNPLICLPSLFFGSKQETSVRKGIICWKIKFKASIFTKKSRKYGTYCSTYFEDFRHIFTYIFSKFLVHIYPYSGHQAAMGLERKARRWSNGI